MINKKLRKKIKVLWSGSKSDTGSITFDDDYTNYDFLVFTISPSDTTKPSEYLVFVDDIVTNSEFNMSIHQSNTVWGTIVGRITSNNTFNITSINKGTWGKIYLTKVRGIIL